MNDEINLVAGISISRDEETGSPMVDVFSELFKEKVGWFPSESLKAELVKELRSRLGGEFANDFDPTIMDVVDMLEGS